MAGRGDISVIGVLSYFSFDTKTAKEPDSEKHLGWEGTAQSSARDTIQDFLRKLFALSTLIDSDLKLIVIQSAGLAVPIDAALLVSTMASSNSDFNESVKEDVENYLDSVLNRRS